MGFLLGFIPMLLVAGFSLALAFYRPNSKPFINMVESGFRYAMQDKLYVWKRRKANKQKTSMDKEKMQLSEGSRERVARLSGSRLRDLAWSLDVLDLKKEEK